jgi:hypothetical protein
LPKHKRECLPQQQPTDRAIPMWQRRHGMYNGLLYFSLIDPHAKDLSYSTIADHPYLYYVRMDDNHGPYQRSCFGRRSSWIVRESIRQATALLSQQPRDTNRGVKGALPPKMHAALFIRAEPRNMRH